MTKLIKILACDGKYHTDENGFLYKNNKPLRPRFSRFGKAQNAYFEIIHNGQKVHFYQETLKELQEKAVGKVVGGAAASDGNIFGIMGII